MKSIDDILKMANDVQAQLAQAQESLDKLEVEGMSGGGLVRVKASAKGRILSIDIDPSLLVPNNKEMVEDLLVAALTDTRARADQAAQQEMQRMTSGMALPPGLKF